MAKSSINFAKVSSHSFLHNDRSEKRTANSVHTEHSHKNEFDVNAKNAKATFDNLYKLAISKVTGKTRRADKKNCLIEAAVNIKTNTTMEDLKKLQKHIEKEFGFIGLQIAMHKDEGHKHKNSQGKLETNLHAHMSFFTLDQDTGRQMFRRTHIDKDKLRELQTKTAKILVMDRGVDKRISGVERLEHKAYKQHIQKMTTVQQQLHEQKVKNVILGTDLEEKNRELAKQKDLKAEITKLREQLQQEQAKREHYAQLEQLNRDLKAQIKSKDLTIGELETKLQSFEADFKLEKESLEQKNIALQNSHKALQAQKNTLEVKVHELEEKSVSRPNIEEYEAILEENKTLQEQNTKLLAFEKKYNTNQKLIKELYTDLECKEKTKKGFFGWVKTQFEEFKEKILGLENENTQLKNRVEALELENSELKTKLYDTNSKLLSQKVESISPASNKQKKEQTLN